MLWACVSPPLQRQADSPSPDRLTGQTNEGVRPNSVSVDLPWGLGTLREYEAFGDSSLSPQHPFPFQGRIRPLEILHTNKIVTNLHPRWGVSGSSCHGDHLQGPGCLRLLVQPRDQEILAPALQLGPVLVPPGHAVFPPTLGRSLGDGMGAGTLESHQTTQLFS